MDWPWVYRGGSTAFAGSTAFCSLGIPKLSTSSGVRNV